MFGTAISRAAIAQTVWVWACCLLLLLLHVASGCRVPEDKHLRDSDSMATKRDINLVLRDHDKELMAIPGVVGVFVGVLPDGKTPCLKVMAAKKTRELQRRVPKSLEGYPVVVEETGPIRPLESR